MPRLILAVLLLSLPVAAQSGGGAGAVPNGADVPGEPLRVGKDRSGSITLSWGDSCSSSDFAFSVYAGRIYELVTDTVVRGSFDNHEPLTCDTPAGANSFAFEPDPRDSYYLIVPHDQVVEGSFGRRWDGVGRPRGPAACRPQSIACGAVPPNSVPFAVADQHTSFVGEPTVIDVLANDVDLDDGPSPLTVISVTQPSSGMTTVLPTQQIQFNPDSAFLGNESFSYTISDGSATATADVSVDVTLPQPRPTAAISVVPQTIQAGETVEVSWSSTDGVEATLNGAPVPLSGSLVFTPIMTTTYELRVTGQPGTDPAPAVATVILPQCTTIPTPAPTLPPCPVWCGSGIVDSLSSAPSLILQPEEMIHALLLPEGYTQAEFDLGIYEQEIQKWIDEWEVIEPYASFKEAFCVWQMPITSNRYIEMGVPDPGDTAFLVPMKDDDERIAESIPLDGATAQEVWDAVSLFPYALSSYPSQNGWTDRLVKNLIPVLLLYDSDGDSYGGRMTFLKNPNGTERLGTAFGKRRVHEFTHALGLLRDEYIEDGNGPACGSNIGTEVSAGLTNVVCDPDCGTVPWRHLIHGTAINPDVPDLVGVFGDEVEGFHPEAKCLMNGLHDNAKYFGGDGKLREDRLCNFCREVTVFRLFERTRVLDDPTSSWLAWQQSYRDPFFDSYPFDVPLTVPRVNSDGDPILPLCPACGDGVLNEYEVCDTDDFGGLTCADFGFEMGDLACIANCGTISPAGCSGGVSANPPGTYAGCLTAQELADCEQLGPADCALQYGHYDCLGGPCRRTDPTDRDSALDDPFNTFSEFHPDGSFRDDDDNLYYCSDENGEAVCADQNGWGVCRRCDPTDDELNTLLGCSCTEQDQCESFNASDPAMECFGDDFGAGVGFCWDTPPFWRCDEGLCGQAPRTTEDDVMYCEYYGQQASCQPFYGCGGGGIEAITCSDSNEICDGNGGCAPECLDDLDCSEVDGWPAGYCCGGGHCQPC